MNPEDLHRLVQVTMFQNAIVVAQILFTIWQLGSDSHFFQEVSSAKTPKWPNN